MLTFVTGASGFIGRRICRLLIESGQKICVLGRSNPVLGAEFRQIDILQDQHSPVFEGAEGARLLHLAWYTKPGAFWSALDNLMWAEASLRLARRFSEAGGSRLIVAGTCAEYGWGAQRLDEDDSPLTPSTLYGATKAGLYSMLARAAPIMGIELAWGRIFNPYGPDEPAQRLLGSILAAAKDDTPAIFSAGLQRRDFMHVDDVANAMFMLAMSDVTGAVNIASGDARPVREFVEVAAKAAGIESRVQFGTRPLTEHDVPIISASVQRLSEVVGFRPRFQFENGIVDAVKHGLQANVAAS